MKNLLNIAKDFSKFPGPRYKKLGKHSGEEFREKYLVNAMSAEGKYTIILDGTRGYGSSFLEEAFGGLVRVGYSQNQVLEKFTFVSNDEPELIDEIHHYIKSAGL